MLWWFNTMFWSIWVILGGSVEHLGGFHDYLVGSLA